MGHPDFRVRGKIFATLGYPSDAWAMVKLNPEQQYDFTRLYPAIFAPVKGEWGRQGATRVQLESADEATVRPAIRAAWEGVAAKKTRKTGSRRT